MLNKDTPSKQEATWNVRLKYWTYMGHRSCPPKYSPVSKEAKAEAEMFLMLKEFLYSCELQKAAFIPECLRWKDSLSFPFCFVLSRLYFPEVLKSPFLVMKLLFFFRIQ